MNCVLICPADRPAVAALAERVPLALLPACGKAFLEHWLEHLALLGAREVLVLAADRPDEVRQFAGDGARWGLRIAVQPEARELTLDEARAKYCVGDVQWLPSHDVILADHLPGLGKFPAFASYAAWYQALTGLVERKRFVNYIGVREVRPHVWVSRGARISREASIEAPCWIGENVCVGDRAQIGPGSIIESGAYIGGQAAIRAAIVAPCTYVGGGTVLRNVLVSGSTVVDWRQGAVTVIPNRFVLGTMACPQWRRSMGRLASRVAAFLVLLLTLPFATLIVARSWLAGQQAFRPRRAVRPGTPSLNYLRPPVIYYELLNTNRLWRRWPQLWNILNGEFAWVGNRPLNARQAERLTTEFDRLWLGTNIGLFSLADAEGAVDVFDEISRAHSAYYAARANSRLCRSILRRGFIALLGGAAGRPSVAPRERPYPVTLTETFMNRSP